MPFIDVTELAFDPDLADNLFQVIRRPQSVSPAGKVTITERPAVDARGAVWPSGDNSLSRVEAYETMANSITVLTTFRLRGPSRQGNAQFAPDLIVFKGSRYIVRDLKSFTQYGAGFMLAECLSIDFVDAAEGGGESLALFGSARVSAFLGGALQ